MLCVTGSIPEFCDVTSECEPLHASPFKNLVFPLLSYTQTPLLLDPSPVAPNGTNGSKRHKKVPKFAQNRAQPTKKGRKPQKFPQHGKNSAQPPHKTSINRTQLIPNLTKTAQSADNCLNPRKRPHPEYNDPNAKKCPNWRKAGPNRLQTPQKPLHMALHVPQRTKQAHTGNRLKLQKPVPTATKPSQTAQTLPKQHKPAQTA